MSYYYSLWELENCKFFVRDWDRYIVIYNMCLPSQAWGALKG